MEFVRQIPFLKTENTINNQNECVSNTYRLILWLESNPHLWSPPDYLRFIIP